MWFYKYFLLHSPVFLWENLLSLFLTNMKRTLKVKNRLRFLYKSLFCLINNGLLCVISLTNFYPNSFFLLLGSPSESLLFFLNSHISCVHSCKILNNWLLLLLHYLSLLSFNFVKSTYRYCIFITSRLLWRSSIDFSSSFLITV